MDPDDTLPPSSERDTLPAPPMLEEPSHEPFAIVRPVTFFPSVLQSPEESGLYDRKGLRFDADAFASDTLDDD